MENGLHHINQKINKISEKCKYHVLFSCNCNYDEYGNKIGNWIVLHKNFFEFQSFNILVVVKFTIKEFTNLAKNKVIGKLNTNWKVIKPRLCINYIIFSGGGTYNENG